MSELPQLHDSEREELTRNRCPDCGNFGFYVGPTGGLSQNIYCCNPFCRSAFNIGPMMMIAQRIGKAPGNYYPPKVHIKAKFHSLPGCGVIGAPWPHWPIGHYITDDAKKVDCPICLTLMDLDDG